jgi:predicted esterase
MPFTQTIRWPVDGRFIFPQGPERTAQPDGPVDGRAWWRLDLASYIPPGKSIPDLSRDRPPGLRAAASLVEDVLRDRKSVPRGPVVLGGFSQGAIVASEVAFRSEVPLSALILLSTTLVDEPSLETHFDSGGTCPSSSHTDERTRSSRSRSRIDFGRNSRRRVSRSRGAHSTAATRCPPLSSRRSTSLSRGFTSPGETTAIYTRVAINGPAIGDHEHFAAWRPDSSPLSTACCSNRFM